MTRPLLNYLHHRRFRLLVRWKSILLARDAFRVPHVPVFLHRLVIQVFEEIVHLLKCAEAGHPVDAARGRAIIDAQAPALTADQYAEILWAGREVLVEFIDGEASAARFNEAARRALHGHLQQIFVGLVEREIRELHRLEAVRNDAMMVRREQATSFKPVLRCGVDRPRELEGDDLVAGGRRAGNHRRSKPRASAVGRLKV